VATENDEPRAYTAEEMRDKILDHVRTMAAYWANLPDTDPATGRTQTVQDRCEGVAFSILSMLDGCTSHIPSITLKLEPHEDDKKFHQDEGENWVEPGMELSFMLHEHFHKKPGKPA
jgi:hypothetical protein